MDNVHKIEHSVLWQSPKFFIFKFNYKYNDKISLKSTFFSGILGPRL